MDIKAFELPKEQLEARLRWYTKRYGPIQEKKGLHNWKNLFKKPTLQDCIIFFMLVMMLFVAWSYSHDINACREFYQENSCDICNEERFGDNPQANNPLGNLIIKEDLESDGT